MDTASGKTCLKSTLNRELSDYHITASSLNPNFRFHKLLSEVETCRIIKEDNRRRVYYLQTVDGGYFLKCSYLVRTKDRLRHTLLPRRRWAEWRNLHRLRYANVPAAKPLAKGQQNIVRPKSYFVLTEQLPGSHLPVNSFDNVQRLGQYTAFLHLAGVYHADLNRKNFILSPQGQIFLLDAQEVYFLPWMPHRLKVNNIGRTILNLCKLDDPKTWVAKFLEGYNQDRSKPVAVSEAIAALRRHQRRRYRSRSKRCCKNSSQFDKIKGRQLHGYKRKDFDWGTVELKQAEEKGKSLKGSHVICYRGVCLKKHPRRFFHQNRCLVSWKMSRALEVRGINVPCSLGYFETQGQTYFLAELLGDRFHLNAYLSGLTEERSKRRALKKLALWIRKFHDTEVWQRDFKSSNVLCRNSDYYMVDLDGVRIRRLSEYNKIYNLAQLNASISNAITLKDRLRFYHYYSADFKPSRRQRRTVYRKVWEISKTKNTKSYDLNFAKLFEPIVNMEPIEKK